MKKNPPQPIPEGRPTVVPYLVINDVAKAIDFLKATFDAEEKERIPRADGSVMHAELIIGNGMVMMGEPRDEFGPMPASIFISVEDCDAVYKRAIAAGGVSVMEPADMHHAGERYGGVKDHAGNIWWMATHIEDLSEEEAKKRAKEMGL